ncbi:3-hexulose-6-phosphate synthase [Anaerolineae bacterium]|nr:3-hexulose-6-phosphate synthase [Anaerolineae bacterium]
MPTESTRLRAPQNLLEQFRNLGTPNISDALDHLGIPGGCHGLAPIVQGTKLVGSAFTVRYIPVGQSKGTVGDFIDDLDSSEVVVIDNHGRTDCTVWGDLMTIRASKMGIAGTVIDGVCRDVPRILELKYPIFTRGRFMVTGKDRVQVDAYNVPVTICGIQVKPGDILVGDDSGVVVLPLEKAQAVLDVSFQISNAEGLIEQALSNGETLVAARTRVGYHKLQSKLG